MGVRTSSFDYTVGATQGVAPTAAAPSRAGPPGGGGPGAGGRAGGGAPRRRRGGPGGGGAEADAVAGRYVERAAALAGAEDGADELAAVAKLGAGAGGGGGLFVLAGEARLGDADRRQVEEEPEVAG